MTDLPKGWSVEPSPYDARYDNTWRVVHDGLIVDMKAQTQAAAIKRAHLLIANAEHIPVRWFESWRTLMLNLEGQPWVDDIQGDCNEAGTELSVIVRACPESQSAIVALTEWAKTRDLHVHQTVHDTQPPTVTTVFRSLP